MAVSGQWDPILQPGHFQLDIRIDPVWRKKGIGDRIYRELESFVHHHGAVLMKTQVADNHPENLAWAEQRGFVKNQHVFASKLDLAQFVSTEFAHLMEQIELSGVKFTTFSEYPQNDEWFERFMDFYYELIEDVPGMESSIRPEPSQLKRTFKDAENWDPSGIILVTYEEEWAGVAWVSRRPDGDYYNHMTGVRKKYRSHGIGIAAKLKATLYAQKQKAHFIHTFNDSNNKPMLQINKKLGFKPTHGIFWLTKTI